MDVVLAVSHAPIGIVMETTKHKWKTETPDAYAVVSSPENQSVVPMAGLMRRTVMLLNVWAFHQSLCSVGPALTMYVPYNNAHNTTLVNDSDAMAAY